MLLLRNKIGDKVNKKFNFKVKRSNLIIFYY